jgi:hypothetical protein
MALVLAVQTDKIEGVDQIRERLGNSGNASRDRSTTTRSSSGSAGMRSRRALACSR